MRSMTMCVDARGAVLRVWFALGFRFWCCVSVRDVSVRPTTYRRALVPLCVLATTNCVLNVLFRK